VLDDHSTDATADLVRALGFAENAASHRLLRGADLPEGWVGKNWACHQLAQAARGEFLLFVDADTTHAPGTVSAAVAYSRKSGADLLSAWPRLITKTWSEKVIIPMILLLGMVLYPHWLLLFTERHGARWPRRFRRTLGAANGQFMLWRRASYERIGGHEAVRDHLVEDVALGREVAARMDEGMRLRNCDGSAFSTVRMYRALGEVWEGFTKNMRAAFEGNVIGFLLVGALQAGCFLAPFVALLVPSSPKPLVAAEIALVLVIRALLTVRFGTSWLSVLLHPIGITLALAIGLNSWRRSLGSGVTWKGRRYAVTSSPATG